jgi:hypothetical protein
MKTRPLRRIGLRALAPAAAVLAAVGVVTAGASARLSAAPQNTTAPAISGTAREGSTLTASNGSWSNSPSSFTYQWQRCATDGTSCGDITGATKQTYSVVHGDVTHTLRVVVTAANADGKATASSDPTDVVSSTNGPSNTVRPSVSGTAKVGEELTVSNGTWSTTPSSFGRQWQRCDSDGTHCLNVAGANGQTYGVRSSDIDHRMRALVTAHTSNGGAATVASSASGVVSSNTTTTTVTNTVQGNKPPTIRFVSLRRVGIRVFARFRVCDDAPGRITIVERDAKARALSYVRRFTVVTVSCGTFSRRWIPAARFRTRGRYVVTLRAVDKSRALSSLVSRALVRH